jgi:rhomboid protease GluP
LLVLLAFSGQIKSVLQLFQTRLKKIPPNAQEFWIATSELAAGETSTAYTRFERLRASTDDGLIRAEIAQRFNRADGPRIAPLSAASQALLQQIEKMELVGVRAFAAPLARPTVVVTILLALNLTVFGAELVLGGSMNPSTLHRLGALELSAVWFRGEYWRLFTALFLHYGPLHLLFNLYALFVIGPGLERALGWLRFSVCYLLSGLGSGFGVLFLGLFRLTGAEQLVGASGCVMGLVGAWAGLLLRHRHAPLAGRRLRNILLIVVVQTAFDLSTPQISMAAHLSGLLSGTILGLIFAPRHFRG